MVKSKSFGGRARPTRPRLRFQLCCVLACIYLCTALFHGIAAAQDEAPQRPVHTLVAEWSATLNSAEAYVRGLPYTAKQHQAFGAQLRGITDQARQVSARAQAQVEANSRLLNALGPAPSAGGPGEAWEIVQKRREINDSIAAGRAQIAQADLAITRAAGLQDDLSHAYRRSLVDQLSKRLPSPLNPATVAPVAAEFAAVATTIARAPFGWHASLSAEQWHEFWFDWRTLLLAAGFLAGWLLRLVLIRKLGRDQTLDKPTYTRRLVAAIAESVAYGVVPAAVVLAIYGRVRADDSLSAGFAGYVVAEFCLMLIFFILTAAFSRAVLAPDLPAWRLTALDPSAARTLSRRIIFVAGVYAFDAFFSRSMQELTVSANLLALYSLVMGTIEGLGIVALMQGRLWRLPEPADGAATAGPVTAPSAGPSAGGGAGGRVGWKLVRWAVSAIALAGVLAAAIGYVRIGHYLIENVLVSITVFALMYLCRGLLREVVGIGLRTTFARRTMHLGTRAGGLIKFWLHAIIGPLLTGIGIYLVLPTWGVPREDMGRWIGSFLSGVSIGGIKLSPIDVTIALIVFAVTLLVTRALRSTLSERVLPLTDLDFGVRNSIAVGFGYIGAMLAVVLAIAVLGIDLSSLALVAGALSVGIGFGLQNIVNNFISGLILLVERPVKVGDWVVVGGQEGLVKRINVRATEIETFERASVILPNSELLQSAVVNWTHKDKTGRMQIRVGVGYGSDTEKVRDVLLECAHDHPEVASWPTPYVIFRDFGTSALQFELRAFLKDVDKRLSVASDLRFAIDKVFRDHGIEIPFAQHDIHLRDIERIEQALAGTRAEAAPTAVVPFPGAIRPVSEDGGAKAEGGEGAGQAASAAAPRMSADHERDRRP